MNTNEIAYYLQKEFKSVLIGGLAVSLYLNHRMTSDIDMEVESIEDAESIIDRVGAKIGFQINGSQKRYHLDPGTKREVNIVDCDYLGTTFDIVRHHDILHRKIMDRAKTLDVSDGIKLVVASIEDCFLSKLMAIHRNNQNFPMMPAMQIQAKHSGDLVMMLGRDIDMGYLRDSADEVGMTEALNIFINAHGRKLL